MMSALPKSIEELNQCYFDGGQARTAGEQLADNPYHFQSPQHESWQEGWWDMEFHLTSRDAELGWRN